MSLFFSLLGDSGYDPVTVAWLARGTALGYTLPSVSQRTKIDTFIRSLRSGGILPLLDILYLFAIDGDSDMATINVITPASFQITKVNTPTFTSNEGFDFNGGTQYLNTNWIPGTDGINYTQNSASVGVYVNEAISSNRFDLGCSNNADGITNGVVLNSRNSGNAISCRINDNTTLEANVTASVGFHINQRRASNDKRIWKDGSQRITSAHASTAPPTVKLFFGASNGNGTATSYAFRELGCGFAGASLSGLENTFYTAWNTYFTSLP